MASRAGKGRLACGISPQLPPRHAYGRRGDPLFALLVFLTLALASYTQTDPSPSPAASGDDIRNWMGASGRLGKRTRVLPRHPGGPVVAAVLYLRAPAVAGVERDDETETPGRWWGPFAMLLAAMVAAGHRARARVRTRYRQQPARGRRRVRSASLAASGSKRWPNASARSTPAGSCWFSRCWRWVAGWRS